MGKGGRGGGGENLKADAKDTSNQHARKNECAPPESTLERQTQRLGKSTTSDHPPLWDSIGRIAHCAPSPDTIEKPMPRRSSSPNALGQVAACRMRAWR